MENKENSLNNQPQKNMVQPQPVVQESQQVSQESNQVKYAGFWIRWVALFIDNFLLSISGSILGGVTGFVIGIIGFGTGMKEESVTIISSMFGFVLGLIITCLYFVIMTYKYQATLGKMAVGIRVVSDKKEKLTLGQVILRETIGKIISSLILSIGYIMAGFTRRKQSLHDKMASTLVIYKDPNKKSSVWIIVVAIIATSLIFIAIIGILASIVLVSLSSARDKASDAAIKASISATIADAIIYQDDNGTLNGFNPNFAIEVPSCSEEPIINISGDGENIAIFQKLCANEDKYFCVDLNGEYIEVDEAYVKGGATTCNSLGSADIYSNDDILSSDNLNNSLNVFKDDSLGYEIEYPSDWLQQRGMDSETGITTITLLPNKEDLSATVYIESLSVQREITPDDLVDFVEVVKGETVRVGGKIYDEKSFTYSFGDGTKSVGKEFKSEYIDDEINLKQLTIAIPSGERFYVFTFISDMDHYDSNYETALEIFNSWKIEK